MNIWLIKSLKGSKICPRFDGEDSQKHTTNGLRIKILKDCNTTCGEFAGSNAGGEGGGVVKAPRKVVGRASTRAPSCWRTPTTALTLKRCCSVLVACHMAISGGKGEVPFCGPATRLFSAKPQNGKRQQDRRQASGRFTHYAARYCRGEWKPSNLLLLHNAPAPVFDSLCTARRPDCVLPCASPLLPLLYYDPPLQPLLQEGRRRTISRGNTLVSCHTARNCKQFHLPRYSTLRDQARRARPRGELKPPSTASGYDERLISRFNNVTAKHAASCRVAPLRWLLKDNTSFS
ncbi:hypothetical protein PR048_014845, partial [Dryococelus australis]